MKMLKIGRFTSRSSRSDSNAPLIEDGEKNNNDIHDGTEQAAAGYNSPVAQNIFNTHEEQHLQSENHITQQELAEVLGVTHDADTSEQRLIQRYVHQHLPKPPADGGQNLHQHLEHLQTTVLADLVRLGPLLESMELMGCLIDCYHCHIFDQLGDLLQNISSAKKSLVLMFWVLRTYLSQELLGHPDLQEMDPIKKVDLLLLTEWTTKAKDKLLENVQREVKGHLEKILDTERDPEADELYVDIIQCIAATPKEAQKISPELSIQVQEVCFQELLVFLKRYPAKQTEILEKEAKMDEPEMTHFFRTLNNCQEFKQYIQKEAKHTNKSLLEETLTMLRDMDAFTWKLLMKIVADMAESHLKKYFKSDNKKFFMIKTIKSMFSELTCSQDIKKSVMDEIYKLIVHIYLKHLIKNSKRKLERVWSEDVGETVGKDADLLHSTISYLVPGVGQWNLLLCKVHELLECKSIEAMKMTVGSMHEECPTCREDQELLPALLRWNGLSKSKVNDVLEVLEDLPSYKPRLRSASCCSHLKCW